MIYAYNGKTPLIAPTAYIADNVAITGDVEIGGQSGIWFGTVIRGDVAPVKIRQKVNVQDNCVLHESPQTPLILEDEVTVGHQVILHSCHVRTKALIGMGSIILDGAEIGEGRFYWRRQPCHAREKDSAAYACIRPPSKSDPRAYRKRYPGYAPHRP